MGEDFGNHRGGFDGGNDLQVTATVRTVFDVDVEYSLQEPSSAHAGSTGVKRVIVRLL